MGVGYISPHEWAACVWAVWQAGCLCDGLEYGGLYLLLLVFKALLPLGEGEQNNQTGLLKVLAPTTK